MSIDVKPETTTAAKQRAGPMPSRFTLLMGLVAIACSASVLITYEAGLVFGLLLGGITFAAARRELRSYRDLESRASTVYETGLESEVGSRPPVTSVWMARVAMALGFVATLPPAILIIFIFFLAAFDLLD